LMGSCLLYLCGCRSWPMHTTCDGGACRCCCSVRACHTLLNRCSCCCSVGACHTSQPLQLLLQCESLSHFSTAAVAAAVWEPVTLLNCCSCCCCSQPHAPHPRCCPAGAGAVAAGGVQVWQSLFSVRSLVVPMHDDVDAWLKFAGLCRKSGRQRQARRMLVQLLRYDPSVTHPGGSARGWCSDVSPPLPPSLRTTLVQLLRLGHGADCAPVTQ
jgi:hypothetical protein